MPKIDSGIVNKVLEDANEKLEKMEKYKDVEFKNMELDKTSFKKNDFKDKGFKQKDVIKIVNKNGYYEKIELAVDTVKKSRKEYEENQTITTDIPLMVHHELLADVDIEFMVNELVNKSIDEFVKGKIKEARMAYNDSDISAALATADAYYGKILSSQFIMTNMRDDYTKLLRQKSSDMISNKIMNLQNKIGNKYIGKLIESSRLSIMLSDYVSDTLGTIVESIISDKLIVDVSNDLIVSINNLMKKSKDKFKDMFKNEIAYYHKVKKAVEDKIVLYKQKKMEFVNKLQNSVKKLQTMVHDQIKNLQDKLVTEISKVIKIDAGAISGAIGGLF